MATTTNFGWSTPDNTGYVKDGALSIRTLGTAVDASMAILRGGTTGQVLQKASGTQMDIVWGTVSSTPRIAQVVMASTSTTTTTTSTTFVDATGLSVSITPTLSTSKILIMSSPTFQSYAGASSLYAGGSWQLLRGSTSIATDDFAWLTISGGPTGVLANFPTSIHCVDSPATTSATTYKVQFLRSSSAANVYANPVTTKPLQIIAMEILV